MRLPLKRGERGRTLELGEEAYRLLEYYMKVEGIDDPSEAASRLLVEGYNSWRARQSRGSRESGGGPWDSLDWCMRVAAGYAYYRLRLSDAIEELRRLTLTLSGVLGDLRLCYEHPEKLRVQRVPAAEKIRRYEEELKRYIGEFIESLRRDIDSGERYARDEDVLEALEAIVKEYRGLVEEGRRRKGIQA
jgi:hypothetical protein